MFKATALSVLMGGLVSLGLGLSGCGDDEPPPASTAAPPAVEPAPAVEPSTAAPPVMPALPPVAPPAADDLCERYCRVTLMTACPPAAATCVSACGQKLTQACAREVRAFYECQATKTPADYECNELRQRRLKPGICMSEEEAYGSCLVGG